MVKILLICILAVIGVHKLGVDGSPSGEISLAAFRSIDAELKIVVPDTVSVNDFKEIPFTAISQGDSSISISKISNTSIGIMRAENAVRGILPGESSSFSFEFLNPTNSSDNFTLSILSGCTSLGYFNFS